MKIIYKGKEIEPYESFYHNTSDKFFRGQLGGGISRCCKCDDSLAVIEVVYEEDTQAKRIERNQWEEAHRNR